MMAMGIYVPQEISFTHIVLEGTPYDVGRQQAEELKKDNKRASFFTPTLPFLDGYSQREAQRALDYLEILFWTWRRNRRRGGRLWRASGGNRLFGRKEQGERWEPFPHGLCLHHYAQGMGTLWSTIFDVTETAVDVCFGAPSSEKNQWRSFGLQDPIGITEYQAHLPDEVADPGFWERMSPGFDG